MLRIKYNSRFEKQEEKTVFLKALTQNQCTWYYIWNQHDETNHTDDPEKKKIIMRREKNNLRRL
jgi:hypothetical protein